MNPSCQNNRASNVDMLQKLSNFCTFPQAENWTCHHMRRLFFRNNSTEYVYRMTFSERDVVKLSPEKNWKSLNESFVSESLRIQRSLINFLTCLWTKNWDYQRMLQLFFPHFAAKKYTVCESVNFFEKRFKPQMKNVSEKKVKNSLIPDVEQVSCERIFICRSKTKSVNFKYFSAFFERKDNEWMPKKKNISL